MGEGGLMCCVKDTQFLFRLLYTRLNLVKNLVILLQFPLFVFSFLCLFMLIIVHVFILEYVVFVFLFQLIK